MIVVAVVTLIAFMPTVHNEFVYWDDDINFLRNPNYRGFWPLQNIRWMFSTTHLGPYQPLAWVTLAVDYLIWGMNPRGYHLTSLLLHTAGAVVLFLVALQLLRRALKLPAGQGNAALTVSAATVALLFAVHPLRVESVAWATERRDTLSGLFFFLALWTYLRARSPLPDGSEPQERSLGWTFILFVLAVLSKGTTLVLPLVMVLLDFYPLRRVRGDFRTWFARPTREVWIEKVPFLVVAVFVGIVAIKGQQQAGALQGLAERDVTARIAAAVYGPAFYLLKTFLPTRLSPLYEWPIPFSPVAARFLMSGVVVVGITVLVVRFAGHWPAGLAVWVFYLIMLAPVLVPFQAGRHLAADRYTYLSCTGWALLVGGSIGWCWVRWRRAGGVALASFLWLVVILLAGQTWRQTTVWRDTWSLWSHAAEVDPKSWHAYAGLADELDRRGDREKNKVPANNPKAEEYYRKALEYYRKALEINPDSAVVYNNAGSVLIDMGRVPDALDCYRRAVRLNPGLPEAHYNLATALVRMERDEEAIDHFLEAIRLMPQFAEAHYNLANTYFRLGNLLEARKHYQLTLRYDRQHAKALDMFRQVENRLLQSPR